MPLNLVREISAKRIFVTIHGTQTRSSLDADMVSKTSLPRPGINGELSGKNGPKPFSLYKGCRQRGRPPAVER